MPFLGVAANQRVEFAMPTGFRMEPDGLWLDRHESTGARSSSILISQPFEILAQARTEQSEGWSLVLRFLNPDGMEQTHIFSRALLASDGAELRKDLADLGFWLNTSAGARAKLMQVLNDSTTENRAYLTSSTGWTRGSFVLPKQTIAAPGADPVHLRSRITGVHYAEKGTLEGWKTAIATAAIGNPLLMFALSLGFTPPLMRELRIEGGMFHLRGPSSCGKTTLAKAAGSIWGGGGPLGFAQTWRGTSNAIEIMFAAHCDTLIVLDELKLVDPNEIGNIVYAATTGMAKNRLNSNAEMRQRQTWRTIALSTGETSLANHMGEARQPTQVFAGQELRFLDIEADGGEGRGAWPALHKANSPAEFANALNTAVETHYGRAGPTFVYGLITRGENAVQEAKLLRDEFQRRACRTSDAAQVRRAAARFGAVAAAGELATQFGLTGWPAGCAMEACLQVFESWVKEFGRAGSHEEREVVRRIADAIEKHGASHFAPRRTRRAGDAPLDAERTQSTEQWGWCENRPSVGKIFLVTSSGWQKIFQGINAQYAARTLAAREVLIPPKEKKRFQTKTDIGGQKHNLYVVKASVTELAGEA